MTLAPATPAGPAPRRARVRVRGLVQGVGFRPFVHRLALAHGLSGWVRNDAEGVLLEVEGAACAAFLAALRDGAPPLARIDGVEVAEVAPRGEAAPFRIEASAAGGTARTAIGADVAVCDDCLAELFDPADRRWRHAFLNCTNCGPRFTIARALPYDRARTSMARFPMCAACAAEYRDPADRRFHAQPTCCPDCGPRLTMPVEEVVARLRAGQVIAVKGIGGYQLACDARDATAVARLRAAKRRGAKPFAVMVAGLAAAERLVEVSAAEAALLRGPDRPILLLRRRDDSGLAEAVAPGLASLGVMLPAAPLHYLLFHEAAGRPAGTGWIETPQELALVMTSANPGGEPLATEDDDAARRLAGIADAICGHDRAILVRADDPVRRVVAGRALTLRRGRGGTPLPLRLPRGGPPVLAVGAELKSAVCVTRGAEAVLSQHIGDLDAAATVAFLGEAVRHLLGTLEVAPVAVAHDLHPDFASTRFAEGLGLPLIGVQHHHAHAAAVLAEQGVTAPTVALVLDGYGMGTDGGAWGGEKLLVDGARCVRLGHLARLALPGGDAAARQPWRMAAAALQAMGRGAEIEGRFGRFGPAGGVARMLAAGLRCPPSSSAGRWFDAACGLLGVLPGAAEEGEAPMRLEALVRRPRVLAGGWRVGEDGSLDLLPLLAAIDGMDAVEGAEFWHGTLAAALVAWAAPDALAAGGRIALSGGCLMNAVLAALLVEGFAARGVEVLLPRAAPPNDGGLALGQAWVALRRIEEEGVPCA